MSVNVIGGFGAALEISCPDQSLVQCLLDALCTRSGLVRVSTPPDATIQVSLPNPAADVAVFQAVLPVDAGQTRTFVASGEEHLIEQVVGAIHHSIAVHSRDVTFVHAGCVAIGETAVVIPGLSQSGKSTLVRSLVAQGAQYLSDEFAIIDRQGRVHPYYKPIAVRDPNGLKPTTFEDVPADQRSPADQSFANAIIIVTAYAADAVQPWEPKPLSQGEAMLRLIENTVTAQLRPADMLEALTAFTSTAPCWEGPRGDASATAAAIRALVLD